MDKTFICTECGQEHDINAQTAIPVDFPRALCDLCYWELESDMESEE